MTNFRYLKTHIAFLKKGYKEKTVKELTAAFNKTFNLNKTTVQIKGLLRRQKIVSGRTGCWKKENKPWNTGTKGLCKANKASLKKGNIPHNIKPLGSESCTKDGYVIIKVAERNPYTGAKSRYKYKQIHIWEQTHGPVPAGMKVRFKDGDKTNFEIENLILVSKSESLALNKNDYKTTPPELKPSVLGLSKLQAKIWEKNKKL